MKSALLSALEQDEQFAFLREKYGDERKWFKKDERRGGVSALFAIG